MTISLASLGLFYLLVSRYAYVIYIYIYNGLRQSNDPLKTLLLYFSGIDVVKLVENLPYVGGKMSSNSVATGASTFVIA